VAVSGRRTANQKRTGAKVVNRMGPALSRGHGASARQGIMRLIRLMGVMLALENLSQARIPPIGRYIYRTVLPMSKHRPVLLKTASLVPQTIAIHLIFGIKAILFDEAWRSSAFVPRYNYEPLIRTTGIHSL